MCCLVVLHWRRQVKVQNILLGGRRRAPLIVVFLTIGHLISTLPLQSYLAASPFTQGLFHTPPRARPPMKRTASVDTTGSLGGPPESMRRMEATSYSSYM
ncbi:hypothetical protein Cni_G22903 [Canna indica]|uniref:Uncharacterized protein n=1 Tax=Canna indica TaxID=4628 RepID=A0AAQ3KW13_9LILI|nr:hypothetical protein Cni_G22903 [Canna indica]